MAVLVAGSPCKIVRENYYPKELSRHELEKLISKIIIDWKQLLKDKDVKDVSVTYNDSKNLIHLSVGKENIEKTTFNVLNKTITGDKNEISEDLEITCGEEVLRFIQIILLNQ